MKIYGKKYWRRRHEYNAQLYASGFITQAMFRISYMRIMQDMREWIASK